MLCLAIVQHAMDPVRAKENCAKQGITVHVYPSQIVHAHQGRGKAHNDVCCFTHGKVDLGQFRAGKASHAYENFTHTVDEYHMRLRGVSCDVVHRKQK